MIAVLSYPRVCADSDLTCCSNSETEAPSEHFLRLNRRLLFTLIKPSAAVACPLRGLTHCVFRYALLHTTGCNVWVFARLSPSCQLWAVWALPLWPLSLTTCFCLQNCCLLDVFFIYLFFSSIPFSATLETVVHENPRRSAVSDPTLSGTNTHSTVKIT